MRRLLDVVAAIGVSIALLGCLFHLAASGKAEAMGILGVPLAILICISFIWDAAFGKGKG
jgi:hypothetical protein